LKSSRSGLIIATSLFIGLALLVGLTWVNYNFLLRYTVKETFLPRYIGTRYLMMKGISPYSSESSLAMQKAVDGSPADSGEGPTLFLHPMYAFPIYAPFALIEDSLTAKAVWMTLLEICLVIITWLSLSLSRWRVSLILGVIIFIFSVTWYYGARPVLDGDISILCALFITAGLLAIRSDQDILAGFLLALSTVKPSLVLVLALFILVWAISHRRWYIFWSFIGSLVLTVAATSLFVPSWTIEYIRQLVVYFRYPEINTTAALLSYWLPGIGKQVGWILTGLMVAMLLWEWRMAWKKDFRWFFWVACLTLAGSLLIGLPTSVDNYIVLFPALVLVLGVWDERWGVLGQVMMVFSLVILSIGIWGVIWLTQQNGIPLDRSPIIHFFLPIFILVGLYWVRWWAINPPRMPLQEVSHRA
jgi:hypothetical protein